MAFLCFFPSRVKRFVRYVGLSISQWSILALRFIPQVVNSSRVCRIAFLSSTMPAQVPGRGEGDTWMNLPFPYTKQYIRGGCTHALSLPCIFRCLTIVKTNLKDPSTESRGHNVFSSSATDDSDNFPRRCIAWKDCINDPGCPSRCLNPLRSWLPFAYAWGMSSSGI